MTTEIRHITGDYRWTKELAAEAFCRANQLRKVDYDELIPLSKAAALTGRSIKVLFRFMPALIPFDDDALFHPDHIIKATKRRFKRLIRTSIAQTPLVVQQSLDAVKDE